MSQYEKIKLRITHINHNGINVMAIGLVFSGSEVFYDTLKLVRCDLICKGNYMLGINVGY